MLPFLVIFSTLILYAQHTSYYIVALSTSPLTETKWKLNLDIGYQNGSWMPKRFPGWGDSGARLGINVDVQFTTTQPSNQRESLVGPKDSTYILKVCNDKPYICIRKGIRRCYICIQRPTGNIKNDVGSLVKPEGLLKFWLDCPSGAKKRDAELFPNTRIFFTTGVWDDPTSLEDMELEYESVVDKLQNVVDTTREIRQENEQNDTNVLDRISDFRSLVDNSKEYDVLNSKKEELERASPPRGCAESSNGVKVAPTGSLVIKGNSIPDWLPGSEYLILGTFSTKALDD